MRVRDGSGGNGRRRILLGCGHARGPSGAGRMVRVHLCPGTLRRNESMSCRIFIENPPPFKRAPRGPDRALVAVPIAEGVETARFYLESGLHIAGFHHSDLDLYEVKERGGKVPPERYDTFDYVRLVKRELGGFGGLLIPHRIVVYETPENQEDQFRRLAACGIRDVVLVGMPFPVAPAGAVYRSTVEAMLAYLTERMAELELNLGVIGIPTREGEPERIAAKYQAAGGRLRVMGQFLDEADSMVAFIDDLARAFDRRGLDLGGLEWNVGLAIFALKDRAFYAKLLRKDGLACQPRFHGLQTMDERIAECVRMNLEFAERVKAAGDGIGLDVGFSIQPLIERSPNGAIHPAVQGAAELAKQLERRFA